MLSWLKFSRCGSIGKLYFAVIPLLVVGAAVFAIAGDSLRNNSRSLVTARQLKELAVESLGLLYRQDDASKALIIDPDDPEAGRVKIAAYDRNQALLATMAKLSPDVEIRALIDRMKQLDDRELRDLDTAMLEALGEGRAAEGKKIYFERYLPARKRFEALVQLTGARAEQMAVAAAAEMEQNNAATLRRIGGALLIGLLLVGLTIVLLIRGLRRQLLATAADLLDRSRETNHSSDAMLGTSHELSQEASHTAELLDETSASLDLIANTTRVNADLCGVANDLAQRSAAEVDRSEQAVRDLGDAMAQIMAANRKAATIVKAMDDLAFGTNILSLNAAVEAARAGAAGAGFAVVADEVRSLAHRSAESARETTELVRDALAAAERGLASSRQMDASLGEVVKQTRAVVDTVSRVAAASQDQRSSLENVTGVLSRIKANTHSNADRAGRGVEHSNRLRSCSAQLAPIADRLMAIVSSADRSVPR